MPADAPDGFLRLLKRCTFVFCQNTPLLPDGVRRCQTPLTFLLSALNSPMPQSRSTAVVGKRRHLKTSRLVGHGTADSYKNIIICAYAERTVGFYPHRARRGIHKAVATVGKLRFCACVHTHSTENFPCKTIRFLIVPIQRHSRIRRYHRTAPRYRSPVPAR